MFNNIPLSKSSNSFVPKSSISGTFGLNIHARNKVTPSCTSGFEKKNGRKTNNTSQQRFFSGDLGMDFSSQTVQDIKWGRA